MIDIPNKLMLPKEVMPLLRVSRATIYRYCDIGLLEAIKVRGIRRITRESVISLLENAKDE
jgi:excisionase family DNA binding protein